MTAIIAIGGAEIGVPLVDGTLKHIVVEGFHKQIIVRTGKKHPRVLFIPTAKDDSEEYIKGFQQYYASLGAGQVDVLRLISEKPSKKEIENKIMSADAIYVNGGNTYRMIRVWKKRGVDNLLKKAHKQGIVMAGHSAGAICWFTNGNSDSFNKHRPFKISALGIVDALLCPHYDTEPVRQKTLKKMLKLSRGSVAIALDECAAIEIIDDTYRVLTPATNALARRAYWQNGEYVIEEIRPTNTYKTLNGLIVMP
jgi:dipeptidase E